MSTYYPRRTDGVDAIRFMGNHETAVTLATALGVDVKHVASPLGGRLEIDPTAWHDSGYGQPIEVNFDNWVVIQDRKVIAVLTTTVFYARYSKDGL